MKKLTLICLIALSIVALASKTEIVSRNDNSIRVKWQIPEWQMHKQGDYIYLQAAGLAFPSDEGAPLLPFDESCIAVPPSGSVNVNITNQISQEVTLEKRILPVPMVKGGAKADEYQFTPREALYEGSSRELITVLPNQRFRNLSYASIRINPFIYDGDNKLKVCTDLEFTVTINGNTGQKNSMPLDDLSDLMAKQMLNPDQAINWQVKDRASINFADFSKSDNWIRIETDKDGMHIVTPAQLNMLDINAIDPTTFRMFTTGGETISEEVNNSGPLFREIPIYVAGESDHIFNSNDYILFYGRDRDGVEVNKTNGNDQYYNPYSKNVCYWLTYSSSFSGSYNRISMLSSLSPADTVTTSPETVRLENEIYQRAPDGFDWYMGKFFGNSTALYGPYSIFLEDIDTTQPQTLSVKMIQEYFYNDPGTPHNVRLNVNSIPLKTPSGQVQTWTWNGCSYAYVLNHTGLDFSGENNQIHINQIRYSADNGFLDYIQALYQKKLIKRSKQFIASVPVAVSNKNMKYDFTGSNSNVRVFKTVINSGEYDVWELPVNTTASGFNFVGNANTTAKYVVAQPNDYYSPVLIQSVIPVDLAHETQSYHSVILAPQAFEQQAQRLAMLYSQKWQKRTKVVMMQDVFNQFSGGMPDPAAIRLFLKYCINNYPANPITSVTILGSGTNDWRNHSGQSAIKNNFIVYQKRSNPNEEDTTTSDDFFGMFNTINYPEMAIGRYPAKTINELNIMLNNFDNYINNPEPGLWRNSLLFVADDENNGDSTGEFYHSRDLHITSTMINKSVLVDKVYAIEYDYDEFQNKPKAKEDMFKALNDGKLVWYYIGHGSYDTLGAEDYFKGSVDMNKFDNDGKLPLFIAASCDVAQFDSFSFDSAAEEVLFSENRGAIASIAATRLSNGFSNNSMFQHFFKYAINFRNTVGYSLVMAKRSFTDSYNNKKYNILGDPLLQISTPERDSTFTLDTTSRDNILNSGEQVHFQGEFSGANLNDSVQVMVFDTETTKRMADNTAYTYRGKLIYKGNTTATASQYNSGFVVPLDVVTGNTGLILAYLWDAEQQKDYVNYLPSVSLSSVADSVANPDIPDIKLYLNDTEFQTGDLVNSDPLLIAKLSDQNGINMTNSPGHSIMLIQDLRVKTTNVTSYFSYDKDSMTDGTLTYPITGLSDGPHTLQMIAFDNLNTPSVATITFTVSQKNAFSIKSFLPYPNPMKKDGYFTFELTEPADVKIAIYTIRGKKIKTITSFATKGYNQLYWDGRDADGDLIANNTYFIKLTAKSTASKGKEEKTEKLIIYH